MDTSSQDAFIPSTVNLAALLHILLLQQCAEGFEIIPAVANKATT